MINKQYEQFKKMYNSMIELGLGFPEILKFSDDPITYAGTIEKESKIFPVNNNKKFPLISMVDIYLTPYIKETIIVDSDLEESITNGYQIQVNYNALKDCLRDSPGEIVPIDKWQNLPQKMLGDHSTIDKIDNYLASRGFDKNSESNLLQAYSQGIVENRLSWSNTFTGNIPYILVDADMIGTDEDLGIALKEDGLYFVAFDVAKEPWQIETLVTRMYNNDLKGAEYAIEREMKFIESIGKQREYQKWQKDISYLLEFR